MVNDEISIQRTGSLNELKIEFYIIYVLNMTSNILNSTILSYWLNFYSRYGNSIKFFVWSQNACDLRKLIHCQAPVMSVCCFLNHTSEY